MDGCIDCSAVEYRLEKHGRIVRAAFSSSQFCCQKRGGTQTAATQGVAEDPNTAEYGH
jgi:hypothetical protein